MSKPDRYERRRPPSASSRGRGVAARAGSRPPPRSRCGSAGRHYVTRAHPHPRRTRHEGQEIGRLQPRLTRVKCIIIGTMRSLPSGTVTFLFTDIEGSTKLLQQHGDRYADLLGEHRRILRNAFSGRGGVEVDTQGDAFFVAFERASDGVLAAQQAQTELASGPI